MFEFPIPKILSFLVLSITFYLILFFIILSLSIAYCLIVFYINPFSNHSKNFLFRSKIFLFITFYHIPDSNNSIRPFRLSSFLFITFYTILNFNHSIHFCRTLSYFINIYLLFFKKIILCFSAAFYHSSFYNTIIICPVLSFNYIPFELPAFFILFYHIYPTPLSFSFSVYNILSYCQF